MEKIRSKFKRLSLLYPNLSSLIVFNLSVKNSGYSMIDITKAFDKLVDTLDYEEEDKETILEYSISISKRKRKAKKPL